MTVFKPGDTVEVLDEAMRGRVTEVTGNQVTVLDADGFETDFPATTLVKVPADSSLTVSYGEIERVKQLKDAKPKKKAATPRKKDRDAPGMVVDLHIEKLAASTDNMSNFDMLDLQVRTFESQLRFARSKRIKRVVFIHGVGDGILRQEVHTILRRQDDLKFYDAPYHAYGQGATEVWFYG